MLRLKIEVGFRIRGLDEIPREIPTGRRKKRAEV